MLVNKALQLAIVAVLILLGAETEAAPRRAVFKVCGRMLGLLMSQICHDYNSPSWDVPTVVEQPTPVLRRKRESRGIADECCTIGCTLPQLAQYCSVTNREVLESLEGHQIEDRSVEQETSKNSAPASPALLGDDELLSTQESGVAAAAAAGARREVGSARSRGYGRARRCWCRRKRRSGRRRTHLMGNMSIARSAARAAPVVGTVSPLLTWGRTLNTDLPQLERDRYAYVAVYTT